MSRSEIVSTDPSTGERVWEGRAGDVPAAVAAARAAFPAWALSHLDDRRRVLEAYRDRVRARAEEFARLISRETGKPFWEAKTEVASVAAKVDISIAAHAARTGQRQADVPAGRQAVRHKPHGVLAVLGPYNFPAHLPNGHIVPALLAGNTVVFKPSEQAPAVAELMARLWAEAGLPPGVINLVQGAGDTGKALVNAEGVDGLLFTGSAAAGFSIHQAFAGAPHRILALEMGGNNPLVVWRPDDTEAAAALIVQSAYISAGQRCTCARRLIVEDGTERPLLEALTALTDRLIIAPPFADPQPFMGPVINETAADRLDRGYQDIVRAGGRVVRPLRRLDHGRPFVAPALVDVTGVRTDDEEHFGPLLQLIRVPDFDAAIRAANDTHFGLAAGLIGGDEALYRRFWAGARAGVINWNRPTTGAASNAPFGGVGHSGNHRPSAWYAADYCAYPVASIEAHAMEPGPMIGLR